MYNNYAVHQELLRVFMYSEYGSLDTSQFNGGARIYYKHYIP